MAVKGHRKAQRRVASSENDAWQLYLDTIRSTGQSYEDIEPWAWDELQATLQRLKRERKRVAA